MSDNKYTWREAEADAHTAAAEAFAYCVADPDCDPEDGAYDAAHEWADGSEWVIYAYRARCLWFDSAEVQDAEDDMDDYVSQDNQTIDERISWCVYHALVRAFADEWETLRMAHEEKQDAEGVTA
jgi:hypothetical protein